MRVLVRGVGDVGSAVAHRLFCERYAVVIHDGPKPSTTRRGMAFADAVFDGRNRLDGLDAVRAEDIAEVRRLLVTREAIPVYVRDLEPLLQELEPDVLVDARMRKHDAPEVQRGLAKLTIGLGPDLMVGRHADLVIETSWDGVGRVITNGASLALAGEPREIAGHARDRYVYAPCDGVFRTKARIGEAVRQGQDVAEIGFTILTAPLDGVLRGLTRDGVPVTSRTKVMEVDPRGTAAEVRGIANAYIDASLTHALLSACPYARPWRLGNEVSPVPARQPAGSALLRGMRDPAGPDLLELRDSPLGCGQVLPRLCASRCRRPGRAVASS